MTEPIRTDCKPRLCPPHLACPACPLGSRSTPRPPVGSHTLLAVPNGWSSPWLHVRVRIRFFAFGFSLVLLLRRRQISDGQSLARPHPGYRPGWVPSAGACRAWVSAPVSHPAAIVAARPTRHDPQAAFPSICYSAWPACPSSPSYRRAASTPPPPSPSLCFGLLGLSFLIADALLRALPSQLHRSPYTLITLGASSAQPAAAVRIPHPLLSIPSLSPVVVVPPTHRHHHHPHCRCPHSHRQRVPTGTLLSHHFRRRIDLIVPHSRPRLHLQWLYALFSSYQHRKSCILSIAIYRLSSPTDRPRLLKPVIEIPIATSYCLPTCFSAE
jgi:hypothetical protein